MICSICLFVGGTVPVRRVTVINGQAVCPEHSGLVQGGEHRAALYRLVEQTGHASLAEYQAAEAARRSGQAET